jgi:hypothetical protein
MISEKGGVRHGFSQIIYNSTEENVLDFITLQFSNLRAGDPIYDFFIENLYFF